MEMESRITVIILCSLQQLILSSIGSNLEARDEKTFSNGTLIGSYTYIDTQGNHVHVKYFADADTYSIYLKGSHLPENTQHNRISNLVPTDPSTLMIDTMVPLKLELTDMDKMYSVENPYNATNADTVRKNWAESEQKDAQPIDYDTFDPILHTLKSKSREKDKAYKKFLRKIRQSKNIYKRNLPIT